VRADLGCNHIYSVPSAPAAKAMTTLIIVMKSGGRVVGRCDANCYDARTPECDCICGGKNHGVGFGKALEQVSQYTQERLKQLAEQGASVTDDAIFNIKQGKLF